MADFIHLHVHTEYSLLDGATKINSLMDKVSELGMDSVAITDHGVMYGAINFYKAAMKKGIKPIIGCEVYTAKRSMKDKESAFDRENGHLILLAENNKGYSNLMKIVSSAFVDGFYYKPRVDYELLEKYSEGIIALSACLAGEIPRYILQNNMKEAIKTAKKLNAIFGENNFFLEMQSNGIEKQNLVNQKLVEISKETGIPLVATNDVHYLNKEDYEAHDVLLCIQTAAKINDEDRMRFGSDQFYFKDQDEMSKAFINTPEAIANTVKIAERCNVKINFDERHLPEFINEEGISNKEYLEKLCLKGLTQKYKDECDENSIAYKRMKEELGIIESMGFIDYFLIVWDFIRYAKEQGIMVGPGRGSAAGSIVSYSLGITNIDPLEFNLLFERFLNPERVSMPDIDIDFCYERRQEVIDYVVDKYGKDRVAQIITFGTMAARGAIRDVGRALDVSYAETDIIAKMIPTQLGITIDKALKFNPQLQKLYDEDEKAKKLIDTARLLEGMPRHASTHAAGVVIAKHPIDTYVPLQRNDDNITTQYSATLLEELGLLKMDFLGLRTLTVIRDAIDMIKINHAVEVDIDNLEMKDENIYRMIAKGDTAGVFQLESPGMTSFMKDLQPTSFEDIIAGISLYRPGPMDQIPRYLKNKKETNEIKYLHPKLEPYLNVTYGCMIYQEQVMQIVRELGGYSMGGADIVRRAMSKKKLKVMEEARKTFVDGCIKHDVDEKSANSIYDEMIDFASYAFNKSHAAAYAVIGYQTAWLKYYYPKEFMAATLNSFLSNTDKISQYIYACRKMNIEVLPPDVNNSFTKFAVIDGKIRFGLAAIKNAGGNASNELIKEREENGLYLNFEDFCNRISKLDVNKRCVESFIKCGALDAFGIYRSRLLAVYEKELDSCANSRKRNVEGQISLFGTTNLSIEHSINYPDFDEFKIKELLSFEKQALGLYLTGNPLSEFEDTIKKLSNISTREFNDNSSEENTVSQLRDGMSVTIAGIIMSKKTKTTKNNNLMAFITLEDLFGTIEVIVFPKVLSRFAGVVKEEIPVLISGKVTIKEEEEPKLIASEFKLLSGRKEAENKILNIILDSDKNINSVKAFLAFFNGDVPVEILFKDTLYNQKLENEYWVDDNDFVINRLKEMYGEDNIVYK